ncbi:MAG: hypothetical protein FGM22_08320 [Burkholderiaceae bacterium]|nr:hypothetical protein [Burkholderiaceae bacterium]
MDTLTLPNDVDVRGTFRARGGIIGMTRTDLEQDDFQPVHLPLENFRIWDAYGSLVGSAAADDLGITAGAFGTGCPYLTAGDLKAAGATTRRARTTARLPLEYVSGQSVRIVVTAGMLTTAADGSCTVDVEAYLVAGDTTKSGSDLVTTAAQSMNSTAFSDLNFELSASTLDAGAVLDIRISISCTDAATATAVTPAIADVMLSVDVKG